MRIYHELANVIRAAIIYVPIAVAMAIIAPEADLTSKQALNTGGAGIPVVADYKKDDESAAPLLDDSVILLNSGAEVVAKVRGLKIGTRWGGCRAVSASEDGRFFVVCEAAADKITMFETAAARELWSLSGIFNSAVFANGLVYAVNAESVFALDDTGTIVKHSRMGGIDIAADPSGDCLWIVGLDIKKCQSDLETILTADPIEGSGGGFSVDVARDGSIWVAARHMPKASGSENRLLKISPEGALLKSIDLDFSPGCVRVHRRDDSVWVTGTSHRRDFSNLGDEWPETLAELYDLTEVQTESHTHKYNGDGELLVRIDQGGDSLEVDPSDGSVLVASRQKIWHYSRTGWKLADYADVSNERKWLAVVPMAIEDN